MADDGTRAAIVGFDRVSKVFPPRGASPAVLALDAVSFEVAAGETVGLVGESGSGKSTIARLLMGLESVTDGRIEFDGADITGYSAREWRAFRRNVQMVFQDPAGSLNPRMTIGRILARPLEIHRTAGDPPIAERVGGLLEMVGLREEHAGRYPHEISGGQQQRVGIARALALQPKLTVLDEPTSALDVSVQAQILILLQDLQREFGLTFLFISHDLSVIRHLSERIAVLYAGRLFEIGVAKAVLERSRHPYTRFLLASVPEFYGGVRPERGAAGEPNTRLDSGCPFQFRCPNRIDACAREFPDSVDLGGGHRIACHNPFETGVSN